MHHIHLSKPSMICYIVLNVICYIRIWDTSGNNRNVPFKRLQIEIKYGGYTNQ